MTEIPGRPWDHDALGRRPGRMPRRVVRGASPDDVLDACAVAWSAVRVHAGDARRAPEGDVPRDGRGLEMAIRW